MIGEADSLAERSKYHSVFDMVYVSNVAVHALKDNAPHLSKLCKPGSVLFVESVK